MTRPAGGYWLPMELHSWPDVRVVGLSALGAYIRCGALTHGWGTYELPRETVKQMARLADLRPLVDRGLWSIDPSDPKGRVTKTMADLRAGRGRRGRIIWVHRRLPDGPQVMRAGMGALGLWTLAASWSLTTDTPGYIPTEIALSFGRQKQINALWDCGLWVVTEHGFVMHRGEFVTANDAHWALGRDDERAEIPPELRQRVHDRDGWHCSKCGAVDDLTLDHIVAWSLGGPDTFENLRTLCRPCNSSKGARAE